MRLALDTLNAGEMSACADLWEALGFEPEAPGETRMAEWFAANPDLGEALLVDAVDAAANAALDRDWDRWG